MDSAETPEPRPDEPPTHAEVVTERFGPTVTGDRIELRTRLLALVAWFEQHPELPVPTDVQMYCHVEAERFRVLADLLYTRVKTSGDVRYFKIEPSQYPVKSGLLIIGDGLL